MADVTDDFLAEIERRVLETGAIKTMIWLREDGMSLGESIPIVARHMPTLQDQINTAMAKIDGIHITGATAVIGSWDGDSFGWIAVVEVLTRELGVDNRVSVAGFQGHTPELSPADAADLIGRHLAEKLGVPFEFPHRHSPQIED